MRSTENHNGPAQLRAEDNEQLLLSNGDAEQIILGGILVDNRARRRVAEIVRCEDFGNALHRRIFAAIEKLIADGLSANPVTFKSVLAQDEELRTVAEAGR
jgi:replicative DNA helicase